LYWFLYPLFISVSEKGLSVKSMFKQKFYSWEEIESAETWQYYFGVRVGQVFCIRFLLRNGKYLKLPGMSYHKLHPLKKAAEKYLTFVNHITKEEMKKSKSFYLKYHFIFALVVVVIYLLLRYIIFPTS
jgi:hypothetical protein